MFPPPPPRGRSGVNLQGRGSVMSTQSKKSRTQTGDIVDLGDDDDFCDIYKYTCNNDTSMKVEREKLIKSFQAWIT